MRPLVLRAEGRRYWLVLEGDRYNAIAPSLLRLRLRELGRDWTFYGVKPELRPGQIADRFGATVDAETFDAAERGEPIAVRI